MEMPNPEAQTHPEAQIQAPEPPVDVAKHPPPAPTWLPSILVGSVIAFVTALSIWYLVQGGGDHQADRHSHY